MASEVGHGRRDGALHKAWQSVLVPNSPLLTERTGM